MGAWFEGGLIYDYLGSVIKETHSSSPVESSMRLACSRNCPCHLNRPPLLLGLKHADSSDKLKGLMMMLQKKRTMRQIAQPEAGSQLELDISQRSSAPGEVSASLEPSSSDLPLSRRTSSPPPPTLLVPAAAGGGGAEQPSSPSSTSPAAAAAAASPLVLSSSPSSAPPSIQDSRSTHGGSGGSLLDLYDDSVTRHVATDTLRVDL